jgi:hypothetical protein
MAVAFNYWFYILDGAIKKATSASYHMDVTSSENLLLQLPLLPNVKWVAS